MSQFILRAPYKPAGDQKTAIKKLIKSIRNGNKYQTLLGVTGSGKTFTMASVIEKLQRPTLIITHNKVLAAQLYAEFKEFFPYNAVEYFISYYDYYQPEAYIPNTDTYIGKETSINKKIEKYRLSTTTSLLSRTDVIVVASVSAIYGLGNPEDFKSYKFSINIGDVLDRDDFIDKLVTLQYIRNDFAPTDGQFRARGDIVDIFLPYRDLVIRVEFEDDTVDKIYHLNSINMEKIKEVDNAVFYPTKIFMPAETRIKEAIENIKREMEERVQYFLEENKLIEAQRIEIRTRNDIAYLEETGYCPGIENYSRHLSGRKKGERPACLLDYFPGNYLVFVDESHQTIPQIGAMYKGDRQRKKTLVEYGFRLPSALDNRPLTFEEWDNIIKQEVFVSATPGDYELSVSDTIAEQIIRPTGLIDPEIIVRPAENQIEDLIKEIKQTIKKGFRVLVTTLTIKMSEDLADYLVSKGIKALYLHSKIDSLERVDILNKLRRGDIDVIVGINLLREGLDLPEVALVAILDADKEGFLRSYRSIVQIAGRTARNINGKVILYADRITESIDKAIKETNRRRKKQIEYNTKHNIKPVSIVKSIRNGLSNEKEETKKINIKEANPIEIIEQIIMLTKKMKEKADNWEFEEAAKIRDQIKELKKYVEKQ